MKMKEKKFAIDENPLRDWHNECALSTNKIWHIWFKDLEMDYLITKRLFIYIIYKVTLKNFFAFIEKLKHFKQKSSFVKS